MYEITLTGSAAMAAPESGTDAITVLLAEGPLEESDTIHCIAILALSFSWVKLVVACFKRWRSG